MRRSTISSSLLTLILLAAPLAADTTRELTRSFPGGTVQLENLAGRVHLTPAEGGEVTVTATIHAEGRDETETRSLLDGMAWGERRGKWYLTYPVEEHSTFVYPRQGASWMGFGGSTTTHYAGRRVKIRSERGGGAPVLYADLEISMPRGQNLSIRNAAGSVSGGELAGELRVDTGEGDVDLEAFDGRLEVDTGSGDVEVERVSGRASIDTGSGDVEMGRVEVEELEADTGSGDVAVRSGRIRHADLDTGSGDVILDDVEVEEVVADTGSGDVEIGGRLSAARRIDVDTGSGDVRIRGDQDFGFDLDADLGSGDVRVGYRDARLKRAGREVVGATRGDGKTRIVVDTGSGDCVVEPR